MEDVPAGPVAPMSAPCPRLSVVIPVRDGGAAFARCLEALDRSSFEDFERIVVDDGSRDDSAALAERHGAIVIRREVSGGPALARNEGARAARAPHIFFLDADVVVHPDTLGHAAAHLDRDPGLTAVFGSYDDTPAAPGLVSQYRNLLHHYVHQQGTFIEDARPAHTFWTGCGLIDRQAFLAAGGFDPERYQRPAIEDIELGYRLTAAGHRIVLARDVLVTHLKQWTLRSMLETDIVCRGVPWMLLLLRTRRQETDLNVKGSQRLSVLLVGLGLLALATAPWWSHALTAWLVSLKALAVANHGFYRFLRRKRGLGFALGAFALHYLYFIGCGLSVGIAWLLSHRAASSGRDPSWPIPRPYVLRRRAREAAGAPARGAGRRA
jgi:GT2 family glycosyltransferase